MHEIHPTDAEAISPYPDAPIGWELANALTAKHRGAKVEQIYSPLLMDVERPLVELTYLSEMKRAPTNQPEPIFRTWLPLVFPNRLRQWHQRPH